MRELAERYDPETDRAATAELMDYSERRLRAEIAELPDGEYAAQMLVEDDGVTADPFEVRVTVVIRGDEIIADFTGIEPAGARADELHRRRRRLGDLQRGLLASPIPHSPDPAQLRLLPADPVHRPGRIGRERRPPGPVASAATPISSRS